MTFELHPEQRSFVDRARDVFAKLSSHDAAWDACTDARIPAAFVPREFGGQQVGAAALAEALVALGSSGVASFLPILTALGARAIALSGSDELKEQTLPHIASGELRIALAVTEDRTGFNTLAIETRATSTDDGYVVDGEKSYVTAADCAGAMVVATRSTPLADVVAQGKPRSFGLTLLLVDTDTPGVTIEDQPIRGELPLRPQRVTFDRAQVPASRRLGAEGGGVMPLMAAFGPERFLGSAMAIGMARFCVRVAAEHARERRVFGDRPIGSYQAIQHPLADVTIRADAAELMVRQAASAFDQGEDPRRAEYLANAAKYLASQVAIDAVDAAIQTLGGRGFDERHGVIQLWEAARLLRTSPISNELICNRVAEHQLRLPRSY